jgi:D-xylose transport system substrate-binding protein
MTTSYRRSIVAVAALLALAFAGGCSGKGGGAPASGGATGGAGTSSGPMLSTETGFTIGVLLPRSDGPRSTIDRSVIEAEIKRLCAKCEVVFASADQDRGRQQSQAEMMLSQGAKVLVLNPIDGRAAGGIVTNAADQKVPVVTYERFADGPVSFHVSYDPRKLGEMQGQALLQALTKDGGDPKSGFVVMLNGPASDPNAVDLKAGAHSSLDGKVNLNQVYDATEPPPGRVRQDMQRAIKEMGADKIIGVYAADDATAGEAIAAMREAGLGKLPPITGQDAELIAIQRLLTGEQYMTVYKAVRPQAIVAAQLAIAAATGTPYTGHPIVARNNGTKDVPSVLLTPVAVTRANINETVVRDGYYPRATICTPDYAGLCTTYIPPAAAAPASPRPPTGDR